MSRKAFARIDLGNLRHNYRLLKERAKGATMLAVVKANAYGHDINLVAPALAAEGCRMFAVTDAREGAQLRHLLGDQAAITLLSGIFGVDDAHMCAGLDLTPVITEPFHLEWLSEVSFRGQIWLKIDTGMQRYGTSDLAGLLQRAEKLDIHVAGLMTHLACADEPEHPLNALQFERFGQARQLMPAGSLASILNSAGIAAFPEEAADVIRPGIALYGSEPIAQQPLGLKPVMSLYGNVIQLRKVKRGNTISYGATYTSETDMQVALVSMGYADGLPRILSNSGTGAFGKQRLPIVGRVCMDYCLLDASQVENLKYGDFIQFWGDMIPANEVAALAGTISYELFTGVSGRVPRIPFSA